MITVRGLSEAIESIQAIASRANDLSPVLAVIAQDLESYLEDSYPLENETGELFESLYAEVTSQIELHYGATAEYAGYHMEGETKIVPTSEDFPAELMSRYLDWVSAYVTTGELAN